MPRATRPDSRTKLSLIVSQLVATGADIIVYFFLIKVEFMFRDFPATKFVFPHAADEE